MSFTGCFCTRVDRHCQGSGGVSCEGSASDFLVDVAGRSGITDTGLEPSGDADSGAGTAGAGTGVEAVGTGDSYSSEAGPRECAGLRASAYGPVGLSGTRLEWATVTCVLFSSGVGMR